MKNILSLALLLGVMLFITGCGSSKYNYAVKPTPLKEGTSKYHLENFKLTLDDSGRNETSNFMNEQKMKQEFEKSLTKFMKKNEILGSDDSYSIDLNLSYVRNYYYMGNSKSRTSIQLPYFKYEYKIYDKNKKLLATYSIPQSQIEYSTFEGAHAIGFQILAGQRKAEHEIEDINHISKYLVKNIAEMGR